MFGHFATLPYLLYKKTLALWLKTTVLPTDVKSLGIDPKKPICFIMETRSTSNLAVLELQCARLGLPSPRLTLGSGDLAKWRSVYALYPQKGDKGRSRERRRDIGKLDEIISSIQKSEGALDVQLVSAFVMWGRPVEKEDRWYKILFSDTWAITGRFKKTLTILIHGRNTWLQFAPPISIGEELKTTASADLGRQLVDRLSDDMYHLRRAINGPDLSHRHILVNDILKAAPVRRAIDADASKNNLSHDQAQRKARKYAQEIAANYSSSAIRLFDLLLTWLWNRIYDGVEVHNFSRLQAHSLGNGLVYVPCHRSHIDYLLLSYVLYKRGLVPPHIAAGINLNIPIVGAFLRSAGAFFMRRSFRDKPLYSAVFHEYLHANFVRGVPIEYFIEGGRSRTGRMLAPRLGMLQMTLVSYLRNAQTPLIFVPTYIGYEKLIESKTYVRELGGQSKAKESVFGLIKAFRKLRGSFGKAYINFGEPLSLDAFLATFDSGWQSEDYSANQRPPWFAEGSLQLGTEIVRRINNAAVVNPINLVAIALLATPKGAIGESDLIRQVDLYRELLSKLHQNTSIALPEMTGAEICAYVEKTSYLRRNKNELGDVLLLDPRQSVLMTYFRNNVLHLFALAGLIASCFINKRELEDNLVIDMVATMLPFLRAELTMDISDSDAPEQIRASIDVLLEMGLLVRHWHTGELRRPTSTTIKAMQLGILAQSVKAMLERYYLGAFLLQQNGEHSINMLAFEELMVSFAKRMSMLYELNSPDYSDKNLFKAFFSTLKIQGLVKVAEDNALHSTEELGKFLKKTKALLNQQVRHSIHQLVHADDEQQETLPAPNLSFIDKLRKKRQQAVRAKDNP